MKIVEVEKPVYITKIEEVEKIIEIPVEKIVIKEVYKDRPLSRNQDHLKNFRSNRGLS